MPSARRAAPVVVLVVASFAFRVPALVNAAATNSDAAIVGLQAMHVLRGEWSPFLFGSTYQTSVDSTIAAAFFLVLGATPLALMLSSLVGHVALTLFAYATLARRLPRWTAVLATLPLVLSTSVVHGNALYPPRQAALTIALASFWVLDAAVTPAAFAIGGALATLAAFADPYATLFLPLLALHAGLAARSVDVAWLSRAWWRRLGSAAAGAAVGALPVVLLFASARSQRGEMTMRLDVVAHNARLLADVCMPWLLATTPYAARHVMDWEPWHAPRAFGVVQIVGAGVLLAVFGYALAARRASWETRRLGIVGGLALPLAVAAFLVSTMVMDAFSTRYLVIVLLLVPFACAPAAERLGAGAFAALIAPWLVSSAVCGWVGYAPFVDGARVRTDWPGAAADDERLGELLRARGVQAGVADYWVAYRETFLFRENPVIVPSHVTQDRYAPYRAALAGARRWAYVVDPNRSEEGPDVVAERLRAAGASFERVEAGSLVAFVVDGGGAEVAARR